MTREWVGDWVFRLKMPTDLRKFLRPILLGSAFVIILLLVVVVVVGWWQLRPKGELRLAMTDQILEDKGQRDIAASLFNLVGPDVGKVSKLHAELSFQPTHSKLDPVPKKPVPGATTLRDLITKLVVGGKIEGDAGLTISVDGIAFLELLWGFTGNRDYFLVFHEITEVTCKGGSAVGPSSSGARCYEITVSIEDVDKVGRSFAGTATEIKRDLAVYLFKTFLRDAELEPRVERVEQPSPRAGFLPGSELTDDFESLEEAAEGFRYLREGLAHPGCINAGWRQCANKARSHFEAAIDETADPRNPSANLGLGLLLMRQAMQDARDGRSSFRVRRKFDTAIRRIQAARLGSGFLEQRILDPNWMSALRLVSSGKFQIPAELLTTGHNLSCAINAYLAGEFDKEILYLQGLHGIPADFEPMISGYSYDGRLELAREKQVVISLLGELRAKRAQRNDVWIYHAVYGDHACRWNQLLDDWAEALRTAKNEARDPVQLIEGTIRNSKCLWRTGRNDDAFRDVANLSSRIDSVKEEEERQRLYVLLGLFYAQSANFDRAAAVLEKAASWPFALRRVQNAKKINSFKDSEDYRRFQWVAIALRPELPVESACGGEDPF